ncbi:MAG: hypothetical protein M2R45_02702 [Verrucomicrobia subdivision 3 bacterium]|nr:hypothetical protein [Limisphaerales bacterium]MCS1415044.1 hypothetical protein [Limisphaerales bacterium]
MSAVGRRYGVLAEFNTPGEVMEAAEKIRNAGYTQWDVHTPFPVHGMDEAMGLKNSKVGWFAFCGGAAGFLGGNLMVWFMNSFNYGIVVGGKPLYSPFFAFPVSYELTILLSAFGSLFGMLFLNRLPRLHHPLLKNRRFIKVTHDKFYVIIECADPKYSEEETPSLLKEAGSSHLEVVED